MGMLLGPWVYLGLGPEWTRGTMLPSLFPCGWAQTFDLAPDLSPVHPALDLLCGLQVCEAHPFLSRWHPGPLSGHKQTHDPSLALAQPVRR